MAQTKRGFLQIADYLYQSLKAEAERQEVTITKLVSKYITAGLIADAKQSTREETRAEMCERPSSYISEAPSDISAGSGQENRVDRPPRPRSRRELELGYENRRRVGPPLNPPT
jgi:hypothetical protein